MTPTPSPDTGDGLVKTLRKRASNHGKMLGNNGFYTASDAALDIEAASRISALEGEVEGLKASQSQPVTAQTSLATSGSELSGASEP